MNKYDKQPMAPLPELKHKTVRRLIKPMVSDYSEIETFVKDQLQYLKSADKNFSVLRSCTKLRKVSPTLVSLIIQKKRKLTIDRLDEIAKLLQLSAAEKIFLRDWLNRLDPSSRKITDSAPVPKNLRKNVSLHLLNDWLNVYVKDCFQLLEIQHNPELLYSHLSHIADPKRIKKSLDFLLREGYLRRTLDQKIVIETELAVAETPVPSHKIRQFHKAALNIAKNGIDTVAMDKRFVNTLVLPLNPAQYAEMVGLIYEFSEKLKNFSENIIADEHSQLYQFNLNLIPTGKKEV